MSEWYVSQRKWWWMWLWGTVYTEGRAAGTADRRRDQDPNCGARAHCLVVVICWAWYHWLMLCW